MAFMKRLFIAILIIIASLPLALLLAFLAAVAVSRFLPAQSDVPVLASLIIAFGVSWSFFMWLLSLSDNVMAFLITLMIPLAYLLAGYPLGGAQWVMLAASIGVFIVFAKLIHRTATPLVAIGTVGLSYGLYLFDPFRPLYVSHTTATMSWVITIFVCWTLVSVAFGLIEDAIKALRKPVSERADFTLDPVKGQIHRRQARIKRTKATADRAEK